MCVCITNSARYAVSSGFYPLSLKGSTVGKFTAKLFSVCSILALSSLCRFPSHSTALLSLPKCRPVLDLACLSVQVCSVWVCQIVSLGRVIWILEIYMECTKMHGRLATFLI